MKRPFTVRVDEKIVDDFKQFVLHKYGKIYESMGHETQQALVHWMAEHGLVAHTKSHKINPGRPATQRKIDDIINHLRSVGFTNQFSMKDWFRACMHTVGSDERTVTKYLRIAKQLGRIKPYAGSVWEIV